jgi:hypothetical protein
MNLRNWFTQRSAIRPNYANRPRKLQPAARQARRPTFRPGVEFLEDRLAPTANIAITNAFVVDGNDNPLAGVNPGQRVYIRANFTTQDLPTNAAYRVRFTVNGQTLNSNYVTWGAGYSGTGHWYMYWGTFLATEGTNQVTATVDPDQSVEESSYADNSRRFTFSANPTGMNPWTGLGGQALSISTARDANGDVDVFAIGTDQGLWYQSQTPNGTWSGWIDRGGKVLSISAIRDSNGNLDVFAIGTNKAVYYQSQTPNGAWSGWMGLGGAVLSLGTTLDATGDLDVFAVGTNKAVYYRSQTPGGTWGGWMDLGGTVLSISPALDAKGNLDVFAIATNQAVYYQSQAPKGAWSGWFDLHGTGASLTTALDGKGDLDVFIVGTDQVAYYRSQASNGYWSDWTSLLGDMVSISAALNANGDLALFGVGTANALYYQVEPSNGNFGYWMALDGGVQSISALRDDHGNYDVFAIGSDSGVWYRDGGLVYSPASGTLFNPTTNKPSYLDVQQGNLADCWLLAGLAEVAARDPQDIVNMFTYDGSVQDGTTGAVVSTYTVRFFNNQGVAQYVTVDTELPDGGTFYDQPINGVLWVALAEKAYAEANGAGIVTTNRVGNNDYDALEYGAPSWLFQAITGKPAGGFSMDMNTVLADWNEGDLICPCTTNSVSPYIAGGHCYALVGYNPTLSNPFLVFNPWGGTTASEWCPQNPQFYGLFYASADFLAQNYSAVATGNGQAPGQFKTELSVLAVAGSPTNLMDAVFANYAGQPAKSQSMKSALNPSQLDSLSSLSAQRLADARTTGDDAVALRAIARKAGAKVSKVFSSVETPDTLFTF